MMGDRDLSEDEVADLKEAFAMFDINGDGAYLAAWRTGTLEGWFSW
jgi:hypothetical protein